MQTHNDDMRGGLARAEETRDPGGLRLRLAQGLRDGGERPESWQTGAPIPDDVFERWVQVVAPDAGPAYDEDLLEEDLLGGWFARPRAVRDWILQGGQPPAVVDCDPPPWWPIYEQLMSERVEPLRQQALSAAAEARRLFVEAHDIRDRAARDMTEELAQEANEQAQATIERIVSATGALLPDAQEFVAAGGRLTIIPLRAQYDGTREFTPRITVVVGSPWIDPGAVGAAYAELANLTRLSTLTGIVRQEPPDVTRESVEFYLAYRALVRRGIHSKQERLDALPPGLRGTRNANSAAAFFGKLQKMFRGVIAEAGEPLISPEAVAALGWFLGSVSGERTDVAHNASRMEVDL